MPENQKEDILDGVKKRKRNKLIATLVIVFVIVMIFAVLSVLAYKYFQSPEYELELGVDIEEFLISEDDNYGYVKLKAGSNDENKSITKVKLIFSDVNGNEYVYETEQGLGNISVPYKKGILDFFKGPEFKGGYNYNVSVNDVSGLESFENVKRVEVVFEYKEETGESVQTPVLDTKKPTVPVKRSVRGSGGGGGGGGSGDGGDTGGCTASLTCADYSGGCGIGLSDGCENILDCSGNCGSGEVCVNESCVELVSCMNDSDCSYLSGVCGIGFCNLTTNNCEIDYNVSTTICREGSNECDTPEYCTGSLGSCPVDVKVSDGIVCIGGSCQGGECVLNESCVDDIGCSNVGGFCSGNTPYTCSLGGDGCLDRIDDVDCGVESCVNGNCVECIDETDCSVGEYCNNGNCVPVGSECSIDSDCEYRGPGFICNSGNECEWKPPIGIPKPEFGIEETYRMYDNVSNRNPNLTYTQNAEGGFYTHYVDNTHPNATDSDNAYGTPEKPRLTVPQYLIAGSVVEVHGGPYQGQALNVWQGISEKPIFVRGINKPDAGFGLYNDNILWKNGEGGQYIIIEGFSSRGFTVVHSMNPPFYNHVALRNSEIYNPSSEPALSGGVGIGNNINQNPIHNIVIYNNEIHNADTLWNNESLGDWDRHGIKPFGYANNIWIVDNYMYNNGGDAIQIGDYAKNPNLHHIYVGRNTAHHNRQTSFWVKSAEDIVFSENTAYGTYNPSGAGMGMQYMPERVWYLFNHIYDSHWGFHVGGSAEDLYFIGNLINDIHDKLGYSPTNPHVASAAISVRGGFRLHAIGNTIYDVDAGIVDVSNTYYLVANNIIANVDNGEESLDRKGMPVWLLDEGGSNNWTLNNNLFYNGSADPYVFRLWTTEYTLDEISNLYPDKSQDNIQADPQFVDAANDDFRLQSTSPVIDTGIESEVYQRFYDLYGIDIRKDIEGRTRPLDGDNNGSAEWDIGAYEYSEGSITMQSIPKSSSIFSTIWNWIKGLLA